MKSVLSEVNSGMAGARNNLISKHAIGAKTIGTFAGEARVANVARVGLVTLLRVAEQPAVPPGRTEHAPTQLLHKSKH